MIHLLNCMGFEGTMCLLLCFVWRVSTQLGKCIQKYIFYAETVWRVRSAT